MRYFSDKNFNFLLQKRESSAKMYLYTYAERRKSRADTHRKYARQRYKRSRKSERSTVEEAWNN